MPVIYTFPTKGTPLGADLVLISDSGDGNSTKNATISSLVTSNAIDVVDTVTASGSGITASPNKGDVVISNTGVTSLAAGANISLSGSTGAITIGSTIPPGLEYSGTWDANTNNPTLASGVGTTGAFYIVSTPGSTNLDGITDWKVGDWAIFVESGATDTWQKVDNSSVLNGSGTGQKVSLWSGSGTSVTLTDSIMTQTPQAGQFTDKYMSFHGGISTQQLELNKGLIDGTGSQGVDGYVLSSTTVGGDKEVAWIASPSSYVLPLAANGTRGGVQIGFTENGKNYPVELASEKMYVNVPWTDTIYTASTGLTLSGTVFNANVGETIQTQAANSATDTQLRTYEIQVDSSDNLVVNVPWTDTNTTYTTATSSTLGLVKIGYTESGKNYPVELFNDQMYVNVPWTDTDTPYTAGTGLALNGNTFNVNVDGVNLVAAENSSTTSARTYKVQVDSGDNLVVNVPWAYAASTGLTLTGTFFSANTVGAQSNLANSASSVAGRSYPVQTGAASGTVGSDHLVVNIPWTDTTYTAATNSTLGLVKLGFTQAGKLYPVELSSEQAYVNVPWTDTDTTYTAGANVSISGSNVISAAGTVASLTTSGTGAATLTSGVLDIPTVTASQGLTKTANDITLDIADPTTGWAILGGGPGATTSVIGGYAGANATGNKNFGISNFISSSTVTSANNNVAVGFNSMGVAVSTASNNVVVGFEAGESMTTSSDSVLIGKDAGEAITTGGENTIIGANAGETITTGTKNTIIGSGAIASSGAGSLAAVAIGREASATDKSVAVGSDTTVAGATGTAVGNAAGTASNAPNGIALGQGAQATLQGTVGNVAIGSAINPVSLDQPEEFSTSFEYLNVTINGDQYYIRLYKSGE